MKKKVLTKALIVDHLNESIGPSKRECQNFFENFLEILCDQLKSNNDVKIVNFGIFKIKRKKERIGRNPKTKEEVMISERNVVRFKASNFLINLLNSNIENSNDES